MLKHFAPALLVTALLAGATAVYASDTAATGQIKAAAGASSDATTPTIKKTKLHRVAKKTAKTTAVSAKKAPSPTAAATDAASKPQTN